MGLIKKIKNSYFATHMEVGRYTKRRTPSGTPTESDYAVASVSVVRPMSNTEFISEFDQDAEDLRREQANEYSNRWQNSRKPTTKSAETLDDSGIVDGRGRTLQQRRADNFRQLNHHKSSTDISNGSQRRREEMLATATASLPVSPATTIVSTPRSPFDDSNSGAFGAMERPRTQQQQQQSSSSAIARARPKAGRSGRLAVDVQSVYFAPGRNVNAPNQVAGAMAASPSGEKRPQFDKNSASSMDYYVFAPNRRDLSAMPLDLKKKQRGGVVAADRQNAQALHKSEIKEEANGPPSASLSPTNPFVVRRKKAQQMVEQGWNSTSPFSDPIVGSGRGGIDPDDPRKHLTTPVYATQADAYGRNTGLDLLA